MGWGGLASRLLQPVRLAVAKAQPKHQQRTVARKTERVVVGGGEEGPGRVLMTIDLELTRKNGEERPGGEGGMGSSKALGFLSHIADQLTFTK
ncbi:hypothetical protein PFLUV_G00138430 [Perca fluviatilis]|uniref:Uncharacterized protein n=1 Tax=Perca fluviatilis TaxID=8168 RepID=A0A6A5EYE7_PERFL|nr:hypothetical protein PFLUV_G00138430 [Perca fluviatilis]